MYHAPTGSTTILVAVVEGKVTVDEINAAMKAAQTESYGYNEDEIVSSDIIGMLQLVLSSMQLRQWYLLWMMEIHRYRLYLGMTMKTLTQARW